MITILTSLSLLVCLALAPAGVDASSGETSTLIELERVTGEAQPTEASEAEIRTALNELEADPWAIVGSAEAIEILFKARLSLVWSLLARGQEAEAEVAMDEAIRSSMGRAMPVGIFGPRVLEVYERRLRALREAGTASLRVECDTCEIVINEHRSPNPSESLYLGSYRVWVQTDGGWEPHLVEVELDEVGAVVSIKVPWALSAREREGTGPDEVAGDSYRPAVGPLGLTGALTIVGGVATAVGGGVLLSFPLFIERGTGLTSKQQQAALGLTAVAGVSILLGTVGLIVDKTVMQHKRDRTTERVRVMPFQGRVEF